VRRTLLPLPAPLNAYSMNVALAAVLDQLDDSGELTDAEALAAESDRPLPPYKRLKATVPTTLPADAPVREVTLKLTGDMMRYLWSINGKAIDEQSTIPVKKGRGAAPRAREQHHDAPSDAPARAFLPPAHARRGPTRSIAPLKHTVDVPPMSRRIIEFYADEDRDWLFHCHLLYHMMAGMARVFSYPAGAELTPADATAVASHRLRKRRHPAPPPYRNSPIARTWANTRCLTPMPGSTAACSRT
jgi:FtsP/CotA-like multicopper oxidase with cupredoxin domain